MTVETFNMTDIISVTPAAQEHFAKQIKKTGNKGIRISLKESGCTGFMYVIDEVTAAEEGDIEVVLSNSVKMFIDPNNIAALRGTQVDYAQQGLNKSLVLNNPNVKEACGCGESFSI